MKKVILFIATYILISTTIGQQQTFDLVTYTPPMGWKKEEKKILLLIQKLTR